MICSNQKLLRTLDFDEIPLSAPFKANKGLTKIPILDQFLTKMKCLLLGVLRGHILLFHDAEKGYKSGWVQNWSVTVLSKQTHNFCRLSFTVLFYGQFLTFPNIVNGQSLVRFFPTLSDFFLSDSFQPLCIFYSLLVFQCVVDKTMTPYSFSSPTEAGVCLGHDQ